MPYELRFESLLNSGRGFAFPCDECGVVNLDELSEKARNNYFFAHAEVGHDFAIPFVRVSDWVPLADVRTVKA